MEFYIQSSGAPLTVGFSCDYKSVFSGVYIYIYIFAKVL